MTPRTRTLRRLLGTTTLVLAAAVAGSTLTATAGEVFFTDVGPDHPFVEDIQFVAESGIAGGFEDGSYRPGQPVSRQAMAAFLHRAQTYRIESRSAGATNSSSFGAVVSCDRGEVAISGGAFYEGPGRAFISTSGPANQRDWVVAMTTDDGTLRTGQIQAFAICVPGERIGAAAGD